MIEIVPAIVPHDMDDLAAHLEAVRGAARAVQVDVVDGTFAHGATWPYTDRDSFEALLSEEEGLPFWEDFDFEVDLMVNASKDAALQWVRAGASRIVVHIESPDDRAALEALQDYRGDGGVEVGLGIALDTPIAKLDSLAPLGDFIQTMGIAVLGHQGEPFDPRALARVRELRERFPSHPISVDGGVEIDNARALVEAGASRLVAGSAIFEGDAKENHRAFMRELSGL